MKTSSRSLRARYAKLQARPGLEALETRAVFNCDNGLDEVHVVFAPDTPAAVVQAYEDLAHQDGHDAFSFGDTDRWSRTATNGSGLTQGTPTIIRWSIVPDGTPVPGYNGEPAAPSNLRSWLAGIYGSNPSSSLAQNQPWFDEVQSVFDRWSELSGVTYVYEPADDGAALGSSASGVINVRGDVRISGHYIDGPSNILAYNFYPTVGDMVLDTGDTFFNNTGSNSLRLRNTMAHELGHGLGLGHVTPTNGTKLMEPSIYLGFDGPQADDILAVNRGYGDRLEKNGGNNTAATAYSLGTGTTFSLDTLSIDDDSDVDWFQFSVGAGASLSVNLTPTGSTYSSNGTTFNSLAQSNLALAVYGNGGSTLLASVNAGGAGVAETLSNFSLPGSGTHYVRVTGDANAAQMYRLSGTISNVVVTNAPEIAVLDGATNIADNTGSVSFGSVDVGGVSSKTFTVQNLGNANLSVGTPTVPTGFILTQAPAATVGPGASTTFIVALDTSVAGTFSGQLSFTNNDADENPFNFTLNGTVTNPTPVTEPEISILDGTTDLVDGASTVNFGSTTVGGTLTKTLTIRNLGTSNLVLTQLVLPTAYSLVGGPSSTNLAPGQSTTLTLALNTASAGTFSGGVTLVSNDADEGAFDFTVTGTVTPTTSSPTTLFSDNFNRASSSYLGPNWQERNGNYSISGQTLVNASSGESVALVNNLTVSDVELTADVVVTSGRTRRDSGLVARHSGASNGDQYWGGIAYVSGRYYAEIWKLTGGVWTRLAQTQVSSGSGSLKFEVIGTSLKLSVNGTLRASASDSSLTSGRVGVSSTGSSTRVDNFVATSPGTLLAPTDPATNGRIPSQQIASAWLAAWNQLMAEWEQRNRWR